MNAINSGRRELELFLADRMKQLKNATIVWACMLPLAIICVSQKVIFGYILIGFAMILGVINLLSYRKLKEPAGAISDPDEFYCEMAGNALYTDPANKFKVLPHYLIFASPEVRILSLRDMEKLEVGIQGNVKKTLFLTDRQGHRNAVVSCTAGDGTQEDFDCLYKLLKDLMHEMNASKI